MWSLLTDYDSKIRWWRSLEGGNKGGSEHRPMFAIATFAVIEQSYCLVLDDYAKLLFTPFRIVFIYLAVGYTSR